MVVSSGLLLVASPFLSAVNIFVSFSFFINLFFSFIVSDLIFVVRFVPVFAARATLANIRMKTVLFSVELVRGAAPPVWLEITAIITEMRKSFIAAAR